MVSLINACAGREQSDPVQFVPDTGLLGSLTSGSLASEHKPLKTLKTGAGILTLSEKIPQRHIHWSVHKAFVMDQLNPRSAGACWRDEE